MKKEILKKQLKELRKKRQTIKERMAPLENWDILKKVEDEIGKIVDILTDIENYGFDRNLYTDKEVEEYIAGCESCQPVKKCTYFVYHKDDFCAGVISGPDVTMERNFDAAQLRKCIRIFKKKIY